MKETSKDKFRDSLGDLLNDLPDEVEGLGDNLEELRPVRSESGQGAQLVKAKNKAEKVMNSLLTFYLSEEIIAEHEYIRAKAQLDESALSMLIRQMQNSETAITLLMETIHEGDVSPRMFEVLSDLQRTLLDIIKSQTMYMVAIEENAKKISRDVDVYHNTDNSTSSNKQSGIKSRGTKDLMRALQDTIKEEDIQDVDGNEDEE
jgi:hypothetical protein|tara:strand:+ start:1050 stop:1661 length:612 start_codon:yes stop_codon:yes gene_type:complete